MKPFLRFVVCGACAAAAACWAQVPARISYQGRLLNEAGDAISSNVQFRIDLFSVFQGGSPLYTEEIGLVPVQDGMYAFAFGTNSAGFVKALTNTECWLEVSVNNHPMIPRHHLLAVPYALQADQLDGKDASAFATGTPLYGFTEADPTWTAEKSQYATGTPLYGYSESDPVWLAERAAYATGTPLYVETDPVWLADKPNYATGMPVYVENDPAFNLSIAAHITSSQTQSWSQAHAWGNHATNGYLTELIASNSFLSRTGGTVNGNVTLTSNLNISGKTTLALPDQIASPQVGALIYTNGYLQVYNGAQWVNVNTFSE